MSRDMKKKTMSFGAMPEEDWAGKIEMRHETINTIHMYLPLSH
jgi:hypothetical protein